METSLKYGRWWFYAREISNQKWLRNPFQFSCSRDILSLSEIEPCLFSFNSPYGACPDCLGLGIVAPWPEKIGVFCKGKRLKPEALHILINNKNISDLTGLSIEKAYAFFDKMELKSKGEAAHIAEVPLREIKNRLKFMLDVGLDYLTLERRAGTLSGGEGQRIRLASQIGSRLTGALYVLDEPTIGLHQRDNEKLIATLKNLRDLGNTVIVVEHDEDTIRSSDYLVDIGPGAGVHGGKIVVEGVRDEVFKKTPKGQSMTVDFLRGDKVIVVPPPENKNQDFVRGVSANKEYRYRFAVTRFVAVTAFPALVRALWLRCGLQGLNKFHGSRHEVGITMP